MFQAQLAGRFPFSDPHRGVRAPDADPALVRDFLRAYDNFAGSGEVALRSDPRYAQSAKNAFAFLDQIGQVRAFLAPFVDSGVTRKGPEFTLVVSAGKDSASDRMLEVGGQGLAIGRDEHEEEWRFGENFVLMRGVAGSSEMKPEFTAADGWSALQFALQQPALTGIRLRFFHPDTKLELTVPSFPSSAPAIATVGK
jgi:hypothetical protein